MRSNACTCSSAGLAQHKGYGALIEFPHHLHHLPFEGDVPHAKRHQGLLVVCGAMIISAIDMTTVNVALPDISEDLNAGIGELQ